MISPDAGQPQLIRLASGARVVVSLFGFSVLASVGFSVGLSLEATAVVVADGAGGGMAAADVTRNCCPTASWVGSLILFKLASRSPGILAVRALRNKVSPGRTLYKPSVEIHEAPEAAGGLEVRLTERGVF